MGKGIVGRWLIGLVAVLLLATPGWANWLPGGIAGHVIDVDKDPDEPFVGLTVYLTTKDGNGSWFQTTDSSGHYSFANVYKGDYTVHIWPGARYGHGYAGYTTDCGVDAGATTTVDFDLTHLVPNCTATAKGPTGTVGEDIILEAEVTEQPGAYSMRALWLWFWDPVSHRVTWVLVNYDQWRYYIVSTVYLDPWGERCRHHLHIPWSTIGYYSYYGGGMANGPVTAGAAGEATSPWPNEPPYKAGTPPTNDADPGTPDQGAIDAEVQNLVITDVATNAPHPDYIIYDPRVGSPYHTPFVDFTIKDNGTTADPVTGLPHKFRWTVTYQKTVTYPGYPGYSYQQPVNVTDIADLPGAVHVPLTMEAGSGVLVSAIRIAVEELLGTTPPSGWRDGATWHLSDPCPPSDNGTSGVADRPQVTGCSYWFEDVGGGAKAVKVRYTVVDTKMPLEFSLDLVSPRGEVQLSSDELPAALNAEQTVTLGQIGPDELEWGSYRLVVCAVDDHGDDPNASQRRDRQPRHMYAMVIDQTVRPFDLDIDTDNDNGWSLPGRSTAEETAEDNPNPGKLVPVDAGDLDNDGIPDWADGFNRDSGATADDQCTQLKFVPVVLQIPANADPATAKVKLTYSASDPSLVTVTGQGLSAVYALPATGKLRLWRKNGGAARTIADDYVAPGEYTAADLGFTDDQRVVTFYLEAVRPSATVAELRLDAEFDLDGAGTQWAYTDGTDGQRVVALQIRLGLGPWGGVGTGWPNNTNPGALVRFWRAGQGGGYGDSQLVPVNVTVYPDGLSGTVKVEPTAGGDKLAALTGYYNPQAATWPLSWTTGNGPQGLYVKGLDTSDSLADIGLKASFTPTAGLPVSDSAHATVYDVDMTIDGVAEEAETATAPGNPTVGLNNDDDDKDNVPDKDDTGAVDDEDDLVTVTARTIPRLPGGVLTIASLGSYGGGTSKLWGDRNRQTAFGGTWDLATGPCPTLWLEGTGLSSQPGDAALALSYAWTVGTATVTGHTDEVPLTVVTAVGGSTMVLKVLRGKLNAQGEWTEGVEQYDPVSGMVYLVAEVNLAPWQRMAQANLTFELREDSSLHSPKRTWTVDTSTSASAWRKWNGSAWVEGVPTAGCDRIGQMPQPTRYRLVIPVQTLKGDWWANPETYHNGTHTWRLAKVNNVDGNSVVFEQDPEDEGNWQSVAPKAVANRTLVLKNMTITSAGAAPGNIDYVKYRPGDPDDPMSAPEFWFTIEDDETDNGDYTYGWFIYVESTSLPPTPSFTWSYVGGTRATPGPVRTRWNGMLPDGEDAPRGTYTYDIWVAKYRRQDDLSTSPFLEFTALKVGGGLCVSDDGADARSAPDGVADELRFRYQLANTAGRPATETALVPLGPDLEEVPLIEQPGTVQHPATEVGWMHVGSDGQGIRACRMDQGGRYRVVVVGQDGLSAADRRDHRPYRMPARNSFADSEYHRYYYYYQAAPTGHNGAGYRMAIDSDGGTYYGRWTFGYFFDGEHIKGHPGWLRSYWLDASANDPYNHLRMGEQRDDLMTAFEMPGSKSSNESSVRTSIPAWCHMSSALKVTYLGKVDHPNRNGGKFEMETPDSEYNGKTHNCVKLTQDGLGWPDTEWVPAALRNTAANVYHKWKTKERTARAEHFSRGRYWGQYFLGWGNNPSLQPHDCKDCIDRQ